MLTDSQADLYREVRRKPDQQPRVDGADPIGALERLGDEVVEENGKHGADAGLVAEGRAQVQGVGPVEEPVEGDVTALGTGGNARIGPRPHGVASRGVHVGQRAFVGLPLPVEPSPDLPGCSRHLGIGVIGQESHERGQRVSLITGAVELEDPGHDVAHPVVLGVGRRPQHGGQELFSLALPELVVGLAPGSAAGKHLAGGHRPRQSLRSS